MIRSNGNCPESVASVGPTNGRKLHAPRMQDNTVNFRKVTVLLEIKSGQF